MAKRKRTSLQPHQQWYASRALRQARKAAGFVSASAAAEALGFTNAKYRAQEAGSRPISLEDAKVYAAALSVPLSALLEEKSAFFNKTRTQAQFVEAVAKRKAQEIKLEVSRRLKVARVTRGFDTGVQAAEAMGIPVPTYLGHEAGKSSLSAATTRLYAAFLAINDNWLQNGTLPSGLGTKLDECLIQIKDAEDAAAYRNLASSYRRPSESRMAALKNVLQAGKVPDWTKKAGDVIREISLSRLQSVELDALYSKSTSFWPLPKGFARAALGVSQEDLVVIVDDDTRDRRFVNISDTKVDESGEFLVLHRGKILEHTPGRTPPAGAIVFGRIVAKFLFSSGRRSRRKLLVVSVSRD